MKNPLIEKLSQYDSDWAKRITSQTDQEWINTRINAAVSARQMLKLLDQDDIGSLLGSLNAQAAVAADYRGSLCGGEVMLRIQLLMHALITRCLDLDANTDVQIRQIAEQESCPEIEKFLAGEAVK